MRPGQDARVAGGKGGAGPRARGEEKGKTRDGDRGPAEVGARSTIGRPKPDPAKSPRQYGTSSAEQSAGAVRGASCAGPRPPGRSTRRPPGSRGPGASAAAPAWGRAAGRGRAVHGAAASRWRQPGSLSARCAAPRAREPPTASPRSPPRQAAGLYIAHPCTARARPLPTQGEPQRAPRPGASPPPPAPPPRRAPRAVAGAAGPPRPP